MITVLTKWKISFISGKNSTWVFYIYDNFYTNVLRKVSGIDVDYDISRIEIEKVIKVDQQGIDNFRSGEN